MLRNNSYSAFRSKTPNLFGGLNAKVRAGSGNRVLIFNIHVFCTWFILCYTYAVLTPSMCLAGNAYHWRTYKAEDGLCESSSLTITLNSKGNVWIKHPEHSQVSCLDGYQISRYPSPGSGPLRILEGPEGDLWSSYTGGLMQFINNQWITHPIRQIAEENSQNPARSARPVSFLPWGTGKILYLLPDQLVEYSVSSHKSSPLQSASLSQIGRFNDWVESGKEHLWITGEYGIAKAKIIAGSQSIQLEWHSYIAPQELGLTHFQRPTLDPDGMIIMVGEIEAQSIKVIVFFDGQNWTMRKASLINSFRLWISIGF